MLRLVISKLRSIEFSKLWYVRTRDGFVVSDSFGQSAYVATQSQNASVIEPADDEHRTAAR